jgi:hypothetical protein
MLVCFDLLDLDTVLYDVGQTTETGMLKLFAFVSCLIRILGHGLRTFKLGRYRQLNKRIGRMIRLFFCRSLMNYLRISILLRLRLMEGNNNCSRPSNEICIARHFY